jgi:hypothetical protein
MRVNRTELDQQEMTALERVELLKRYVYQLEDDVRRNVARLDTRLDQELVPTVDVKVEDD